MSKHSRTTHVVEDKQCTKCLELWPADSEFFHREPRNADGLTGECIACKSAYDQTRNAGRFCKHSGALTQELQGLFTAMLQKRELPAFDKYRHYAQIPCTYSQYKGKPL